MQSDIERDLTAKLTKAVHDVWPALVANELMKLQGESRPRTRDQDELLAQCQKLRAEGKSQAEIAKILGTSQPNISRVMRASKNGVSGPMKAALAKHGSRTAAAKALGLPRQTFSDRLAKES